MTLILRRSDIAPLLDMRATIDAVELAMAEVGRGAAIQPQPALMRTPDHEAGFIPMSALSPGEGLAAVKLLADIPANRDLHLPTQRSSIVLVSARTGEVVAILDGALPTRYRTAAATAVATKYLARPDSTVLGLVGAGGLASVHVEALREVLPLERVVCWTRSEQTAASFMEQVAPTGLEVKMLESPDAVVSSCDVVCTLTPSTDPIVSGDTFHPGLHVNAVGARPRPDHRVIDTAGMTRASVFVDSLETVQRKSGDVLIPVAEGAMSLDDLRGEVGSVVAGSLAGRTGTEEVTMFKSVGLGIQDLAIGRVLVERALQAGRGITVDLSA